MTDEQRDVKYAMVLGTIERFLGLESGHGVTFINGRLALYYYDLLF
jgi:hypothetical protein